VVWLGRSIADSSWEIASSLPTYIVKEYEDGVNRELYKDHFTSAGQTVSVISSKVMQQDYLKVICNGKMTLPKIIAYR